MQIFKKWKLKGLRTYQEWKMKVKVGNEISIDNRGIFHKAPSYGSSALYGEMLYDDNASHLGFAHRF